LLQDLMDYPVMTAGRLMAPRGLGTMVATFALKPLLRFFDTRILIGAGFAVTSLSIWSMSGFYLQMDNSLLIWSGVLLGFGVGLSFVPLATVAFATLPIKMRNEGTSVFSLMRNLGSSIGIAGVQVLFIRNTQILHARLVEHVTPFQNGLRAPMDLSSTTGLLAMNGEVTRQATMMAYNNVFKLMFLMSIACVPLVLLLRKAAANSGPEVVIE
jgi:DHA2 family multidrug resistance protein